MATNPNEDQDAILKKPYEYLKSERNMVNNMDEKNKKASDKDVEDIQKGVRGGVKDVPKGARDDVGRGIDKEVKKVQKK